jgi:hypothetical protein
VLGEGRVLFVPERPGRLLPHHNLTKCWRRRIDTKISKKTRREVLDTVCERYSNASKIEKSKILDEFVHLARCHRKYAISLLTRPDPVASTTPKLGRTVYSEAVRQALIVFWEAADRICSKRLKAILPGLVSAMERHGHLALDPTVRKLLLAASPATIDRLLAPNRGAAGRHRKPRLRTKSGRGFRPHSSNITPIGAAASVRVLLSADLAASFSDFSCES